MKTTRFAPALILALALAGPPPARADEAKPKSKLNDVSATLEAKERQTQDAFKNKDKIAFMTWIDSNAWAVDPTGLSPVSKASEMMNQMEVRSYTLDQFKTIMVDHDTYVATYEFHCDATMGGQPYPPGPWYCSTVWARHGKEWKAVFHQQTLAMAPAPAAQSH